MAASAFSIPSASATASVTAPGSFKSMVVASTGVIITSVLSYFVSILSVLVTVEFI